MKAPHMVPQNSGKDELLEKKERILHCFNQKLQSKGTGFFIFGKKIRRSGGESYPPDHLVPATELGCAQFRIAFHAAVVVAQAEL